GGFWLLPRLIFSAYAANSTISGLQLGFSWGWLLTTWGLAVGATGLAAGWVLAQDAREIPAQLLLPPTPKGGARLWLEHVTPVWRRLAFKHKATLRNLWRYKSRMLMTILGVAGCTGLLVMGFGIRDSLHGIGNIQYSEVQKNDVIALKNRHVNTTERQKLNKIFTSHDVTQTTAVQYQQLTKHLDSTGATENLMLIAPQSTKNFSKSINLQERQSKKK